MLDAYIYDGTRTSIGRYGGSLASVRPDDLVADLISTLVERNPFGADAFEDVVLGCTNQAGEDCRNIARRSGLLAGLPVEVAGATVNRLCASGLAAIVDAGRAASTGQGDLFMAGGVESMSRAPFVMPKAESGYSRTAVIYDTTIGSRFPNKRQTALFGDHAMPETADNVAKELDIARADADDFALASQAKYADAKANDFFDDEITPISVKVGRKGETRTVDTDEHPRPNVTMEALAKLRPLYEDGVVTAGNASGVNDGAAVVIVGNGAAGEKADAKPRARIVSAAVAGVEPRIMGLGPVPASRKALERAGLTLDDMDVIEINEAFASQVLGCLKQMGVDAHDSRLNPNGGAIALGHPLGASGARLALTAIRQLERTGGRYALVTLCIGVGQGMAVVFERMS